MIVPIILLPIDVHADVLFVILLPMSMYRILPLFIFVLREVMLVIC